MNRSKQTSFVVGCLLILTLGIVAHGHAATPCTTIGTPAVATDRDVYDPGQTVVVSGKGFACRAALTVRVTWPADLNQVDSANVVSDASGGFVYSYLLGTHANTGQYDIDVLDSGGHVLASTLFHDSHFRYGHITWTRPTQTSLDVTFKITLGFRASFPFGCGTIAIGAPCNFGTSGTLFFGDGQSVTPTYAIIGYDATHDWILAEATIPHSYASAAAYSAYNANCCRVSRPTHINNPDANWRVATAVNLGGKTLGSPAGLMPPIVDCPRNAVCQFPIYAADPDTQQKVLVPPGTQAICVPGEACAVRFRLAQPADWAATYQPGLPYAPQAAAIQTYSCAGNPCGIYTWDTTNATPNSRGDTLYSTQVVIEQVNEGNQVLDSSAIDFFIRLVDGPTGGSAAGETIRVPVRMCGVQGAPALAHPDFVGASDENGVLEGRLDRINQIYGRQTRVQYFLEDSGSLGSVPIIDDPDSRTPDGSVANPATNPFEWLQAVHDCRVKWQQVDNASGLTMVHFNKLNAGDGWDILGIAYIPRPNNAVSEVLAGVATVVDNSYVLRGESYGGKGNDNKYCEGVGDQREECQNAQEVLSDKLEVLGDMNAGQFTGNNDGRCNPGERCVPVGNDDGVCELREACGRERANDPLPHANNDGLCDGPDEQCHIGDPFDAILAHEIGHSLGLYHGNGFDNDGQFLDGMDHLVHDGVPDQGEADPGGTEPIGGHNLMQYGYLNNILTLPQALWVRRQAQFFPNHQLTASASARPSGATFVDPLGDVPQSQSYLDIDAVAAVVDPNAGTTGLGLTVAGLLPNTISNVSYEFLLDSDNSPATGGDPSNLLHLGGAPLPGIDVVGHVSVAMVNGVAQATPTLYTFDGSQFVASSDPSITALVERPGVQADMASGDPVVLPPIIDSIQLQFGNQVRGSLANAFTLYAISSESGGTRDDARGLLSVHAPQFPGCTVNPGSAFAGSIVTLQATGLRPNTTVNVLLGLTSVTTGTTTTSGSLTLPLPIPSSASGGTATIRVDDTASALSATCAIDLEAAPAFVIPANGTLIQARAGQPLNVPFRAADSDFNDTVSMLISGAPLTLGATFSSAAGNPATGSLSWTPSASLIGNRYLLVATAADQDGIGSTPLTVTVEVVPADTTPPTIHVELAPNSLWPPNHKMVPITATVTVTDDTDPAPQFRLLSVTSNEPDDAPGAGDGATINDIVILDSTHVSLRAERDGAGSGRIYTMTYEARDRYGNTATVTATVTVAHDNGTTTSTDNRQGRPNE